MDRRQQDLFTYVLAAGVIVASVIGWFLFKEVSSPLVGGAFGLLGLPSIRAVNDTVKRNHVNGEA